LVSIESLFSKVLIVIMSEMAIQTSVQGMNDGEKAQFVYSMANSRRFTVSVCTHDHQNYVSVVYAYGKATIDDFTNIVRKPRAKKEKMDAKCAPQEIIEIKSTEDQQIITIDSEDHTVVGVAKKCK
jgi:hypothetical protein